MTLKVLVVDDSSFFRRRVTEIINSDPNLEVIDSAINGKEAVEKAEKLKPDVITMDIEMPVMNGIAAVRQIMASNPTPILMFSSLTHEGAKETLDALDAGALDFIPKKFEDIARNREEAILQLQQRVKEIARKSTGMQTGSSSRLNPLTTKDASDASDSTPSDSSQSLHKGVRPLISETTKTPNNWKHFQSSGKSYLVLAIATSTGGPIALQKILSQLPKNFPYPILLIQHMPEAFTAAFAQRLNLLCQINVTEAKDGEMIIPGTAYLAPGGLQMMVEGRPGATRIKIVDSGEKINYKPSADITFGSISKIYTDKVLSLVLTGMGSDGKEGARILKEGGSTVWAQDEETSVVYGMPQAVSKAGISTLDLPIEKIPECVLAEMNVI